MRIYACIVCCLLLSVSCGSRSKSSLDDGQQVRVADLIRVRSWTLQTDDPNPQPQWAPSGLRILVRSGAGLGVLQEGQPRFYDLTKTGRIGWATWITPSRIIAGPPRLMEMDEERPVEPSMGMTVFEINRQGISHGEDFGNGGYRPRLWNDQIVANVGEVVWLYNSSGTGEEYDFGFEAEPQKGGPGFALQTAPIHDTNYWTDQSKPSDVIIRWKEGAQSTIVRHAVQPRWTVDGGVVVTSLHHAPISGQPWHMGGSDILYVANADTEPQLVMEKGWAAVASPTDKIIACNGPESSIYLVDYSDKQHQPVLFEKGYRNPIWSSDGRHLCAEKISDRSGDPVVLRVWSLKARTVSTVEQ